MSLGDNINTVRGRIENACAKSGRTDDDVTLVAVSKKFPLSVILEAYGLGLRDFGENYAQELRDKQRDACAVTAGEGIRWHFIGNLQRNKVKYVADEACLLHAVDSMTLVAELDRRASAAGVRVRALVEINAGEKTKGGIAPEALGEFLEESLQFSSVSFEGLMMMPPYFADSEKSRPWFAMLREMRDSVSAEYPKVRELSMGMSNDFDVAIEEGATIVRVGSAIFGERTE